MTWWITEKESLFHPHPTCLQGNEIRDDSWWSCVCVESINTISTVELPTLDANVVEDLHEPNIIKSCSSCSWRQGSVTSLPRRGNEGAEFKSLPDANRDSGFKPRPSGWGGGGGGQSLYASPSTQCPSGAGAILMGLMWGSGGSACETLVQSEHAQFKAWWVLLCHHQNIPNQWVWIWWLWKRRPVLSFG